MSENINKLLLNVEQNELIKSVMNLKTTLLISIQRSYQKFYYTNIYYKSYYITKTCQYI